MSKILLGVFVAVFVGALFYELFNRTTPELMGKFELKLSEGLDDLLMPKEGKA